MGWTNGDWGRMNGDVVTERKRAVAFDYSSKP